MARLPKLKVVSLEKTVLERAQERIATAFDNSDTVVVAFSGGKDSTVVLNLCLEEARRRGRLPLDVCTFDEEAIPYQTEEYYRRVWNEPDIKMRWYCAPVLHRNACSSVESVWHPWAPEKEDLWVRPMPPEAEPLPANFPVFPIEDRIGIPNTNPICFPPREFGRVAFMMGIRADESLIRRQAVTRKTEMNYRIQGKGIDKYYPIYDWRTPDVWRAPKIFGWDYNRAYELMEMVGIPHHSQRIAPPYGEQPFKALWMFKVCFPEIWDKMSMRVHGALTAARYAQSPLYGIGAGSVSEADLAQGQTWVEKISEELEKWEPGQKEWVTRRIQSFITSHHNATTDPITFAPHPVSGISWKMLHKIAKNGDFKSRTVPKYITPNTPEAQRIALMKKYEQSLGEKNDD